MISNLLLSVTDVSYVMIQPMRTSTVKAMLIPRKELPLTIPKPDLSSSTALLRYQRFSDLRSSDTHIVADSSSPVVNLSLDPMLVGTDAAEPISPACAECVTDCIKPTCPAAEITPQCTDQCVVIACSDPNHDQMNCNGAVDNTHCDIACDSAVDCAGCPGFEDFLHCCTDYHSYFSEPKAYTTDSINGPFAFDQSFEALFCGCGEQDTYTTTSSDVSSPAESSDFLHHSVPLDPIFPTSNCLPVQHDQTFLPYSVPPIPLSDPPLLGCQWGDCHATFSRLSDLIEHVNHLHLQLTISPFSPISSDAPAPQIQCNQLGNLQAFSCLWGDCNVNSSPNCMSSGIQSEMALDFLASHLFQDHLGLQTSLTLPVHSNPQSKKAPSTTDTPSPRTSVIEHPVSPPPLHDCSGAHLCRWQSCKKIFASCDELTTHITDIHIGAGKARYGCYWEGCGRHGDKGFASKQKICRHLQTHTGHRPFQCKICSQNFSEAATLQQHIRRHTQEKPYKCDFPGCGKTFAITGALTIHKRTHNGHKPFKCHYCEKAFSESSNLSKHLRTHTGLRPYACGEESCGKSFARPDQLARHMGVHRKKHGGVMKVDDIIDISSTAKCPTKNSTVSVAFPSHCSSISQAY